MKKLMTLAALVAACAPAFTAEVTSSNTVGYQKITLQPGYNAIAAKFVPVGANGISDILSVMKCSNLPTIDVDTETGEGYARLLKWDPVDGYIGYEWTGEGVAEAWEWDGIDNKWMTAGCGAVASVDVGEGEGVWLWLDPEVVSNSREITVSGEVPSDSSITLPLVAGYNLIANPYPVAIGIQDIVFSNLPTIDFDTETGEGYARLQTWDPVNGYTGYEWTGEGVAQAWEWDDIDNKWMTAGCGAVAPNVQVPAGESFWLWLDPETPNLSSNASVTFTNPIQ